MANMHLITGYKGSSHVTAADMGSLYAGLFGSDSIVLKRGNQFEAEVISNNSIRVKTGDLILKGRHVRLTNSVDMSIDNGASGYKRNDLIVARYSKNASTNVEECNLVVIKGTATTGGATDPTYNNGDILDGNASTCDFPLYRVKLDGLTATVEKLFNLFEIDIPSPSEILNQITANLIKTKLGYTPAKVITTTTAPTVGTSSAEPVGTLIGVYEA